MTKRMLLSLGLVAATFAPVRAELLKNVKLDGSIEVKTFSINNETDALSSSSDTRGETRTRVLGGVSFDLLDDVHGRFLIRKNNRIFGAGGSSTTFAAGENLNTVQSNLVLDNAYVKIDKVFSSVDFTIGRQFYGDGNDQNIYFGPNPDDTLSVQSLDIFRADSMLFGALRFQGIAGKLADAGGNVNTDTDLYGVEVAFEKIAIANLAAYYYSRIDKVGLNDRLDVAGLRAAGDIVAGIGYKAEFIQNFGRIDNGPSHNGTAWSLGAHAGFNASVPVRAHLGYGQGTESFQGINPGKRYGKIWGEHTSNASSASNANRLQATGLNNLRVFDIGVGANVLPKLGVDFNVYRFQYMHQSETSAGTEYDLIVSWKHSDNVSFEASAASFQPGDGLTGGQAESPITRVGADVKIKF